MNSLVFDFFLNIFIDIRVSKVPSFITSRQNVTAPSVGYERNQYIFTCAVTNEKCLVCNSVLLFTVSVWVRQMCVFTENDKRCKQRIFSNFCFKLGSVPEIVVGVGTAMNPEQNNSLRNENFHPSHDRKSSAKLSTCCLFLSIMKVLVFRGYIKIWCVYDKFVKSYWLRSSSTDTLERYGVKLWTKVVYIGICVDDVEILLTPNQTTGFNGKGQF